MEEIYGLPIMDVASPHLGAAPRVGKRAVDVALASIGLVLLAPLLAAIAITIKLSSPGPVLFRQTRLGQNRRPFTIFKFRTMRMGAEGEREELRNRNQADGPLFKMKQDPRFTTIGRALRCTSMDELPQLWNVVLGHMSLVGPRPLVPDDPCELTAGLLADSRYARVWGIEGMRGIAPSMARSICMFALGLLILTACQGQRAAPPAQLPTAVAPPAEAPQLNLVAGVDGTAALKWPAVEAATGYWWWQVLPSPSPPVEVTDTQVTVSGLFPGRMYTFAVAAANKAGWSPVSPLASVTIPADWQGLAARAAPFVYWVKFASCGGDGCSNPIAAGYSISLPTSGRPPTCRGSSAPPPDRYAHWVRLPCWSQHSNLFFVTAYHIFCNSANSLPELLNAGGNVVYWSSAGCAGRYTGPVSKDVAGQFTSYGTGGITRATDGAIFGDQLIVLGATRAGQITPEPAKVLAGGIDFQEPAAPGFGGVIINGAIAINGSLAGTLVGSPVLNGKGEVLGAFMPPGPGPHPVAGDEATGYVVPW